jgi:hypothetical protein
MIDGPTREVVAIFFHLTRLTVSWKS